MAAQMLKDNNFNSMTQEQLINVGIGLQNKDRYPLGELDKIYEAGLRKKYPGFAMILAEDYPPFKPLEIVKDFNFLINKYKYFLLFSIDGNVAAFNLLKLAIRSKNLDNVTLVLTLFTPAKINSYDWGHRAIVESLGACADQKIHKALRDAGFIIEKCNSNLTDKKLKQEVFSIKTIDIDVPLAYQKLAQDTVRLHPKINRKDLYQNGSLLLPETILALKKYHKDHSEVVEIELHQISLDPVLHAAFSKERRLFPIVFVNQVPYVVYQASSRNQTVVNDHQSEVNPRNIQLGKGAVSFEVILIQNPETCEWFADKIANGESKQTEVQNLKQQNLFIGNAIVQTSFNTVRSHLVMKLAFGETISALTTDEKSQLLEMLKQNPNLALKRLLKLFIYALIKLNNMHDKDIIHNDLHADNIMVDFENEVIEFVDFGASFDVSSSSENHKQLNKNADLCRLISNLFIMLPIPIKTSLWFNEFELPEIREVLMKKENEEVLQLLVGLMIKLINHSLKDFSMSSLINMCCQCYFNRFKEEIRLPDIQLEFFSASDQQEIAKVVGIIREKINMSEKQYNDAIYQQMKQEFPSLDIEIQGAISAFVIPRCLAARGLQESDKKKNIESYSLEFLQFCQDRVMLEFKFRKNRVIEYPSGNYHERDPRRRQHRIYYLALFRFAELCQGQIQQRMASISVAQQAPENSNGVTTQISQAYTPAANTAIVRDNNNPLLRGNDSRLSSIVNYKKV